jgi:hypothetical protein
MVQYLLRLKNSTEEELIATCMAIYLAVNAYLTPAVQKIFRLLAVCMIEGSPVFNLS